MCEMLLIPSLKGFLVYVYEATTFVVDRDQVTIYNIADWNSGCFILITPYSSESFLTPTISYWDSNPDAMSEASMSLISVQC